MEWMAWVLVIWYLVGLVASFVGMRHFVHEGSGERWSDQDIRFCFVMAVGGPLNVAAVVAALLYHNGKR